LSFKKDFLKAKSLGIPKAFCRLWWSFSLKKNALTLLSYQKKIKKSIFLAFLKKNL